MFIKEIDHTICVPTRKEILASNKEFAEMTQPTIPGGLPHSQPTDHKIVLKPNSRIPTQRLHRQALKEYLELQTQLGDLLDKGFIEPSVSPYSSESYLSTKQMGNSLCAWTIAR